MMEETTFGAESSRWPETRQNWAITVPPGPGATSVTPSAPPSGWPPLNSNCLPGLESLMHLDRVFVDQRMDRLETFIGWPQKNKYVVMDSTGQQLFYLKEESSAFSRLCCGNSREFNMRVYDRTNREVLRMHRPTEFWMSQLEVYAGNMRIGTINEKCAMFYPEYDIYDDYANRVFQISGPCCICDCFGPTQFQVFSADASREIGVITKTWSGLMREVFTNADIFGVSFPTSLDVKMKALLVAAAILIDFEHFELN